MIDHLLRRLIPGINEHLSDDQLASYFCNELTFKERLIVRRHLLKCWYCRLHQEDLEGRRADEILDFYRNELNSREIDLSPEPRAAFMRRLGARLNQFPLAKPQNHLFPKISLRSFFPLNPAFSLCLVLGAVAVIFFFDRWQKRIPNMTSNSFLVRAETWDWSSLKGVTGVVYQSVRITGPKITMDRAIYRDPQGKRLLRKVKLADSEENLKAELARAGVDWDKPISATDYRGWRDQQHGSSDSITRAGTHLLKLTTTVPDSSVLAQSLTVRDTDFHPVRRTIALRNVGMVEIAELDFRILPLSAVSDGVFEPPVRTSFFVIEDRGRIFELPRLPQIVTSEQLDGAELSARLVLNQLHADSGEQIELQREQQEVVVEGVVETDERKQELQKQLGLIPHVRSAIQSIDDLKNAPASTGPTSIQMASMPDEPSPLELFMQKHDRSLTEGNALAQQLSNEVLTISRESKAIDDLQTRFVPKRGRDILTTATLTELIYSHRERLNVALKNERALLAKTRVGSLEGTDASPIETPSLSEEANRNLALLKELTQTHSPAKRSAEEILPDMEISLQGLSVAANNLFGKPQPAATLSKRK